MFFKKFLSLFVFIILSTNLFSHSMGNKNALTNIKKIELIDKGYRTLAVLPFENLTKKDEYSYIGKTIQKFLSANLNILTKFEITTNDFLIPEKYKTNNSIVLSYGTNFFRDVIILKPALIYKKYINAPHPENLNQFSKTIQADYIISGKYSFIKKSKNNFKISYNIYNVIQNKIIYNTIRHLNEKKINKDIDKLSSDIIQFFHPAQKGFFKLTTDFSNYELFIDNIIMDAPVNLFELPVGKHKIKFQVLGHPGIITNILIEKTLTNNISFYEKSFLKKKAILNITSEPANAFVYLNINLLGSTPLSFSNLNPGSYRLKVSKTNCLTSYQNIQLNTGKNTFTIALQKIQSKKFYEERHKKNKTIMYISLGVGTLSLLNCYFFYANGTIEWDRFKNSSEKNHLKKRNTYMTISLISGFAGLGCLTISLIHFLKVINYDDVNIGFHDEKNIKFELALKNYNNYFFMKYRF